MFSRSPLRTRMLATGLLLVFVPLAIIFGVVVSSEMRMRHAAAAEVRKLASQDLDHLVHGIEAMCVTQQAVLEDAVSDGLAVTRATLAREGEVNFAGEPVAWRAVNQLDK